MAKRKSPPQSVEVDASPSEQVRVSGVHADAARIVAAFEKCTMREILDQWLNTGKQAYEKHTGAKIPLPRR